MVDAGNAAAKGTEDESTGIGKEDLRQVQDHQEKRTRQGYL